MPGQRHTVEQIVAQLRQVEKLQGEGIPIPKAAKRVGITDQTFYRWRARYGALKEDEAARLKLLEQENSRLKKIVAEQALDISMLKDLQRGNGEPGATEGRGGLRGPASQGLRAPGVSAPRAAPVDAEVPEPRRVHEA